MKQVLPRKVERVNILALFPVTTHPLRHPLPMTLYFTYSKPWNQSCALSRTFKEPLLHSTHPLVWAVYVLWFYLSNANEILPYDTLYILSVPSSSTSSQVLETILGIYEKLGICWVNVHGLEWVQEQMSEWVSEHVCICTEPTDRM
jgi:hypothetical protein